MRWRIESVPRRNEVRIFRKFAWLPYYIGNEARWLEFITIKCVYRDNQIKRDASGNLYRLTGWVALEFIDEEDEEDLDDEI